MLSAISKQSKEPLLFDIRIKNTDGVDDVLLIKGGPNEASSVLLSGIVVFSVLEPVQVKSLSLKLTGKITLNIPSNVNSPTQKVQRYLKYEKIIFTHNWDNFNIETYFDNLYDNFGSSNNINSKSSSSLVGLQKKRARSKSNGSMMSLGSNQANYRTLVKGNYEFPFSAILPGSLNESIEGLSNAAVVYKLQATIERGKAHDIICVKHLRVVRTLSSDAVELSESVAVDNSWPNKVEYSISTPSKAVAVGSATPITITFVPLLKGLRLGAIKIKLIQTSHCIGGRIGSVNKEEILTKLKLKDPLGHIRTKKLHESQNEEDVDFDSDSCEFQDRWEVETVLNVPPSLVKCTQDTTILSNIKIRHKIKFTISLINPDGHVSELRASLPIQLFVSPFVAVNCKSVAALDNDVKNFGKPIPTNSKHEDTSIGYSGSLNGRYSPTNSDLEEEIVLFARHDTNLETQVGSLQNNLCASAVVSELMTPPNYGRHVYDRLWSMNSNAASSVSNSPVTPNIHARNISISSSVHSFSQLGAEFHQLEITPNTDNRRRESSPQNDIFAFENHPSSYANAVSIDRAGTPVFDRPETPVYDRASTPVYDRASTPVIDRSVSPLLNSATEPTSRDNSFVMDRFSTSGSPKKDWELSDLSRVPSYDKAMHSNNVGEDLPPSYADDFHSGMDRLSLERPQGARYRSTSLLSAPGNRQRSASFLSRSNNSSSSSLNILARSELSVSNTNIPIPMSVAPKNNTASKQFSFNMTPVSTLSSTSRNGIGIPKLEHVQPQSIQSIATNERTTSFSNFIDFFSRKD